MGMLRLLERTYQDILPGCRVVTSTGTGLIGERADATTRSQVDEIAAALSDCRSIVVHSLSNNGHNLWTKLLRQLPTFSERVWGMVFDCGPSGMDDFSAALLKEVVKGTLLSAAMLNEIQVGAGKQRTPVASAPHRIVFPIPCCAIPIPCCVIPLPCCAIPIPCCAIPIMCQA